MGVRPVVQEVVKQVAAPTIVQAAPVTTTVQPIMQEFVQPTYAAPVTTTVQPTYAAPVTTVAPTYAAAPFIGTSTMVAPTTYGAPTIAPTLVAETVAPTTFLA